MSAHQPSVTDPGRPWGELHNGCLTNKLGHSLGPIPTHCELSRRLTTFRQLANRRLMSSVFKALSDPTRRRVLQLLRQGAMSAGEISDRFEVSKPTMSAHFAVLKEADLIHAEKVGKSILYHLKLSVLEDALLGFVHSFGLGEPEPVRSHKPKPKPKGETV